MHGFYPSLYRMEVIKLKGMRWAKGGLQMCLIRSATERICPLNATVAQPKNFPFATNSAVEL
jgi:hypothetical protein